MPKDALDRSPAIRGRAYGVGASVAFLKLGANGVIDVNTARAPDGRRDNDEQRADGEPLAWGTA